MTINSVTVVNGSAGNIGPPGPSGPSYNGTSTSVFAISVGPKTFITQPNLAYLAGSRVRFSSAALPVDDWMEGVVSSYAAGVMLVTIDLISATRDSNTHNDWNLSSAGHPGQQGNPGAQGVAGRPGNVIWHGVAAPSGTSPASPVDGDYYLQSNPAVPGSAAYLWGPYAHASTPPWGSTGLLLAVGPTGPAGPQGAPGATGAVGPAGPQGPQGPNGTQGVPGSIGPAGPTGAGYNGTSTTSASIGIGSVTITTQPGLAYVTGLRARFAAYSAMTNWMEGQVTAYDYASGSITINAVLIGGSGTFNNWTIAVAGEQGQQGPTGASGSGTGDMLAANNLSDLTNKPQARTNLQLATVANTGAYADLSGKPLPPTQRSVTASPITVTANDEVINCNIASGTASCNLPSAATRAGRPLVIKDVGGQFAAHALTINCAGAEKADGLASITLNTNYQFLRLVPANDGVNTGWSIV
jgi:hypothetical protein